MPDKLHVYSSVRVGFHAVCLLIRQGQARLIGAFSSLDSKLLNSSKLD